MENKIIKGIRSIIMNKKVELNLMIKDIKEGKNELSDIYFRNMSALDNEIKHLEETLRIMNKTQYIGVLNKVSNGLI